jgi:hypothetical protein
MRVELIVLCSSKQGAERWAGAGSAELYVTEQGSAHATIEDKSAVDLFASLKRGHLSFINWAEYVFK